MPIKDKKHHKDLRSNEIVKEYLSITHLILLLLSITPIEFAMRMQNEVLLAHRKLFRGIVYDPAFVTSKSGPFSSRPGPKQLVEDAIDVLEDADLIHIKKADAHTSYVITKAGKEKIMDKIIRYRFENVKTNKIEWDSWDLKQLSYNIFINYPEFSVKTELRYILDIDTRYDTVRNVGDTLYNLSR